MELPKLGLGTYLLQGRKCVEVVSAALDIGYQHIDTAAFYDNHREIGMAMKDFDRDRIFITSKAWHTDLTHDRLIAARDRALAELGTEYLDLYLIHWPNDAVPISETMRAFKRLHDEGKVRGIGVSNFDIRHLQEAIDASELPIAANQVEFHPYLHQPELLASCKRNGVQLIAYSPLAMGRVHGDPAIMRIAQQYGRTPGQVALRWLLDKGIAAIPKASSRKHLEENIDLRFKLSPEDTAILDSLPQQRLMNPGFFPSN